MDLILDELRTASLKGPDLALRDCLVCDWVIYPVSIYGYLKRHFKLDGVCSPECKTQLRRTIAEAKERAKQ